MKTLILFFVSTLLLALSSCSILEVTNDIEEEAIRLWEKFCEGKQASVSNDEPGNEDNTYVYCKTSPSTTEVPVFHDTEISPPASEPNPGKVVIFIRPTSIDYNHNVTVRGQGPPPPKTVIYVKPVEHNHSISVDSKTTDSRTERPVVYYLKNRHNLKESVVSTTTTPRNIPIREPNTPFTHNPSYFQHQVPSPSFNYQNIQPPQYFNNNNNNGYNFQRRYN